MALPHFRQKTTFLNLYKSMWISSWVGAKRSCWPNICFRDRKKFKWWTHAWFLAKVKHSHILFDSNIFVLKSNELFLYEKSSFWWALNSSRHDLFLILSRLIVFAITSRKNQEQTLMPEYTSQNFLPGFSETLNKSRRMFLIPRF